MTKRKIDIYLIVLIFSIFISGNLINCILLGFGISIFLDAYKQAKSTRFLDIVWNQYSTQSSVLMMLVPLYGFFPSGGLMIALVALLIRSLMLENDWNYKTN